MSYLEKKLGSLTSGALDKLSNLSGRTTKRRSPSASGQTNGGEERQDEELQALRVASPSGQEQRRPIGFQFDNPRSPFSAGIPFGGDPLSFAQRSSEPTKIGFREDLIQVHQPSTPTRGQALIQTTKIEDESTRDGDGQDQAPGEKPDSGSKRICFVLPRIWFFMFALSMSRLMLFIAKVYEDFQATKHYSTTGLSGHFLVSAATLFLPTLVFTIYRVSRYLQTRSDLFKTDADLLQPQGHNSETEPKTNRQGVDELNDSGLTASGSQDGPPQTSGTASPSQLEDEGLVTARQTPTNLDANVFHDSKDTEQDLESPPVYEPPKRPQRAQQKDTHEGKTSRPTGADDVVTTESRDQSAKLDLVPVAESHILIGIGEQILHGLLFVFWQLKRQVDVLSYLIGRACIWRKPNEDEDQELGRLQIDSDGLEWFEDFYAAFLAILTQVYSLGVYWFRDQQIELPKEATSDFGPPIVNATGFATSTVNKALSKAGGSLVFKDLIVISELIVSSAVVVSLLVVVRRRDDGPLTRTLSSLGWGSLFSARIIVIGLAFVHLGPAIIFPLVGLHTLAVALWVYKIALDSHNDKPGERLHEAEWDEEVRDQVERDLEQLAESKKVAAPPQAKSNTSHWTISMHLLLLTQIFTLFAIPSLFYWPIMFNLRLHFRPFKYLLLVLVQNFLLIIAIWYKLNSPTPGQLYLLGAVGGFSIVGFIFVALYVALKPEFTEYFVRADMEFNQAEQAGVYYEFCSRILKMPDLRKHSFGRLMKQEEREEVVAD